MTSFKVQVNSVHVPVLLHEIVETFRQEVGSWQSGVRGDASSGSRLPASRTSFWYVDGTLGGAGHALALAKEFQKATGIKLNVIGFDRDNQAIARAQESLKGHTDKLILENENYRNLDVVLAKHDITAVDFILLDLGISSDELDDSGRGFTFLKDEPLWMTMGDPAQHPFTAQDIVNGWKEEDIANVIFGYGEDRYARRIAKKIVEYREKKKIETTMELAEIIKGAVPKQFRSSGKKMIHPATKTFQALRIAVNDELGALKEGLIKGYQHLAPGGRMAVISFHSLEDRIVKEFFKEKKETGNANILTKKPVTAVPQEIAENPRSRSAKLRILEKK
ncbi:MAG TPA: 16S rRNA (cytosine(1402)-N(4))-methyltransferase RsmH [Candidatus Paceibacterota bacterium]|nr:16S rRNA (cytosine(1402)-N(4))-methyltransferase RsmH [Candidatus Paceibacterota bacterium]